MDISGERWREHRKFAVLQLRELGVGKPLMESKILIETEELLKKLKTAEYLGEDLCLQSELDVAVGSVINQFLFGYRFDESKLHEFVKIKTLVNNFMEEVGKPLGVLAFTCHGIPPFIVKRMVSGLMLIHQEIDEYLGHHRRILTMSDKNALVYFNAFANETQRLANILPMNLPHALTRDVVLKGYHLKKGTGIIHQIANVMTDETIFKDPYRFDPNRFIDENGKLKKIEELCPFSMGKRQCVGEGLARMEIFLLAANLFNYFEFVPGSEGLPSLFKDFSLVSHVIPFKCQVRSRDHSGSK
ncbi:hypothetical protein CAEBREN_31872 [Caenorhabditis brenneri]|uniref:Uncharacterized protein n=1 Tax=Caenorhabditis brenneri TaxID=135651 RepID=G0PMV1_CAEBE|nr:hypothetical protein CAEBREN_31872 [Caenorhabditis brenneri]